ncbi:MAG: class I SAM-dependent methyltransferase [Candidatus Heimdallarchaeota archaeon]
MNQLKWITERTIPVGNYAIPCSENLQDQSNHIAGIRRDLALRPRWKSKLSPLRKLKDDLFVGGFIKSNIGKWIKEFVDNRAIFLEVGCGDMSLAKYLPEHFCYNAFDLSLSEFHLLKILKKRSNINIALASATNIPLESNSVSLIVSTEVFEHIPEIETAIKEIHRIAMPGAKLLCSIPNNYCFKYRKKGPHPQHVNNWSYADFIAFMHHYRFNFLKGHMRGFWIPFPLWLTKTSYQLPFSSNNEYYNTNFFFVFDISK